MEHYLTYGIQKNSGRIISVTEAERGLSCDCFCPECNGALVKKDRGEFGKRKPHFAHYRNTEFCSEEKAYESALHKLGKQILSENKSVFLPEYSVFSDYYGITLPSKEIRFDVIDIEKRIDDLIPDIIGTNQDGTLWIELVNTHYIDSINSDKLHKIRDRGIECIEIDLKGQNLDNLKEFLLNSDKNRNWINSPTNEVIVEELQKNKLLEMEKELEESRKAREAKFVDFNKRINEWKEEGCIEYYLNPGYNRPLQCPKYQTELNNIKSGRLYTHPIIRDIVDKKKGRDGKLYCNGKIYYGRGACCYYKENEYQIFDNPLENNPKLLYAGLKKIEEIREISCFDCEFNKLNSVYDLGEFSDGKSVCSYR